MHAAGKQRHCMQYHSSFLFVPLQLHSGNPKQHVISHQTRSLDSSSSSCSGALPDVHQHARRVRCQRTLARAAPLSTQAASPPAWVYGHPLLKDKPPAETQGAPVAAALARCQLLHQRLRRVLSQRGTAGKLVDTSLPCISSVFQVQADVFPTKTHSSHGPRRCQSRPLHSSMCILPHPFGGCDAPPTYSELGRTSSSRFGALPVMHQSARSLLRQRIPDRRDNAADPGGRATRGRGGDRRNAGRRERLRPPPGHRCQRQHRLLINRECSRNGQG